MKRMFNKILIGLLLCFAYVNVFAKTIYLKECEYTDDYIKWLELSDKEKKKTQMPLMCKNSLKDKFSFIGSSIDGVSANDSKFDLRDHGMVTSVKNQSDTGACWAFATNASIESNLLMNGLGEFDLSEAHLELATQSTYDYGRKTFSRVKNTGGNYLMSQAYFMNQWGPVLEEYLPFQQLRDLYAGTITIESSTIINSTPKFDVNASVILGDEDGCTDVNIADIKEYLVSEGALSVSIHLQSDYSIQEYLLYDGNAYQDSNEKTIEADQPVNHGVTIVGWDDTISKDNFSSKGIVTRDGAFIIKNSYGEKHEEGTMDELKEFIYSIDSEQFNEQGITDATLIPDEFVISFVALYYGVDEEKVTVENGKLYVEIGNKGYQYISYDDVYVCSTVVGFKDIDTDIENHNYGYSDLGASGTVEATSNNVYLLNYFDKVSQNNEILNEVVMYFIKPNQQYKIYFADKKTTNIKDAVEIANGTSKYFGYETIKLNKLKRITSDTYSIFVELIDTENVKIPIIYKPLFSYGSPYASFEATEGVQFLSLDAKDYADLTKASNQSFNYVIKINTNDETGNEVIEPDVPNIPSNDENNTPTPPSAEEENNTPTPPVEEDSKDDEITTDNNIVVEPNDYNKENETLDDDKQQIDETVDKPLENPPKTGLYVPIFIIGFAFLGTLVIKKKFIKSDKIFRV